MSKRSAKRREEWRQERIEAIGKAMGRFVTAAGAGVQVNLVKLAEVAVDALDEYDRERRLDMEDEKRAQKSERTTVQLPGRAPIVFDFDGIRPLVRRREDSR